MSFLHIFSWLAWLIAVAWLWKAIEAARGIPNIPEITGGDVQPTGEPSLTVIVPARNEEANVADCLRSLLAQDYSNLQIIAVDDRSTDKTGAIMDGLAAEHSERLGVLHIDTLPAGWLGKTHAMAVAAQNVATDYLLFTDADILFQPDALRRSLAYAVASGADHFVTLPTPIIKSRGEGMLLGFLQTIGLWVTRPWRVSDPQATRDFVGIGAFCLLRTAVYKRLGGFESLRLEILEDLNLAQRIKKMGLRQVAALSPGMVQVHWASGAMGIVRVMAKNLFALFQFRVWLLLPACVGIATLFLLPVVFLFRSATVLPGLLAVASIVWLYRLAGKLSGISSWYAVWFPVSTLLFIYSLLRSMLITLKQGGVNWRGTFYSLSDLRKTSASD